MISNFKLFENVERAKKLLNSLEIDPQKSEAYSKIREMLRNTDGYVYWFCKLHFVDKVPLEELSEVFDVIKNNKPIIQKFPKNIVDLENIEEFWDNWNKTINDLKVKKIINELPSTQKGFVSYQEDFDKLLELANNKNKQYFLRKVSRYKNKNDFLSALNLFLSNKMGEGYDKIISFLKEKEIPIFYQDKENDIIIIVVSYSQILDVGRDTSWCIVRSESTFKSYNNRPLSRQFVIFLTDETGNLSKIGVTTSINGMTAAHFKNDASAYGSIKEILAERGVDYRMLIPSKETILKTNIKGLDKTLLLDMLSKEEILDKDNTINGAKELLALDITKEDVDKWGLELNIPTQDKLNMGIKKCEELGINYSDIPFDSYEIRHLLNFGFTEEEILSKKNKLIDSDYYSISKDNFLKYNIIDKIQHTDYLAFLHNSIDLNTILKLLIDRKPDKLRLVDLVYERVINKGAEINKETIDLLSKIDWGDYIKAGSKAILFTFRKRRQSIIENLNKDYLKFRYSFKSELWRFNWMGSDDREKLQKLLIKFHKINFTEVDALSISLFLQEDLSVTTRIVGGDEGFSINFEDFLEKFSGSSDRMYNFLYTSITNIDGKFIETIRTALLDIFKKALMTKSIYIYLQYRQFVELWERLTEYQKNEVREDFDYSRMASRSDGATQTFTYLLDQGLVDKKNLNYLFGFFRGNSYVDLGIIPKEMLEIIPDNKEYLDKLKYINMNMYDLNLYEFCIKNDILLNTVKEEIKSKLKSKNDRDDNARLYELLKQVEKDLKELEDYDKITRYNLLLNSIDKMSRDKLTILPEEHIAKIEKFWERNGGYILSKDVKSKLIEDGKLQNLILLLGYIKKWEVLPSDVVILNFNIGTYTDKNYIEYIYNYLVKNLAKNINKMDAFDKITPDIDKETLSIIENLIRTKEYHISWILRFLMLHYPTSDLVNVILDWVKGAKNNRASWVYSKDRASIRTSRLFLIKGTLEYLFSIKADKRVIKILNYINPTKAERKDVFEYMWGMDKEKRNYYISGDYKNEPVKESRIYNFGNFIKNLK